MGNTFPPLLTSPERWGKIITTHQASNSTDHPNDVLTMVRPRYTLWDVVGFIKRHTLWRISSSLPLTLPYVQPVTHHPNAVLTIIPGPAVCAKRLNPPPPEGSERVWIVFEMVFNIFKLFQKSPARPRAFRGDSTFVSWSDPKKRTRTYTQPGKINILGSRAVLG